LTYFDNYKNLLMYKHERIPGNQAMTDDLVTGDMQLLRKINGAAILHLIQTHGPISRVALARLAKLTPATAFSIVEELVDDGLVRRSGIGTSAGGRRPILFEFNPGACAAVSVDVRADRLITMITDLEARPLAKSIDPYTSSLDGMQAARRISQATQAIIRNAGVPQDKLVGLGISVPALVNLEGSVVIKAINLGWEHVPLRDLLAEVLDLPIHILDVSLALTVAEANFGAGRGVPNLVCVNVGSGIGSGIVVGNRIYRGADGVAGEIGHMTVDEDGPRCRCGNYGCLERLAAGPAIVERAVKGLKQGALSDIRDRVDGRLENVSVPVLVEAAQSGDDFARGIWAETGRYLGIGIASVVNALNPDMVIVGGDVTQMAGELLLEPLRQAVKLRAFEVHARRVSIVAAKLGIEASAIGAGAWAMLRAGFPASPSVPCSE
jgi:predicted NBD/HSP70 family sugar kinase